MGFKIRETSKPTITDETQLLSTIDRLVLFTEQHRRAIIIAILALVVLTGTTAFLIWLETQRNQQALDLERKATRLYLDRPFVEENELKENLTEAIKLYRQVIEEYPRSPSAEVSLFYLGNSLMDQEDFQGAIQAYQDFIDRYSGNDILLGLVYQRLGYLYLLESKPDEALNAFTSAYQVSGALNKDQILYEQGKLEEASDRTQEALEHYRALANQYPTSPFASEASIRVESLEGANKQTESEKEEKPQTPDEESPEATDGN